MEHYSLKEKAIRYGCGVLGLAIPLATFCKESPVKSAFDANLQVLLGLTLSMYPCYLGFLAGEKIVDTLRKKKTKDLEDIFR